MGLLPGSKTAIVFNPDAIMSADLTWQIVKKSNRYLLRNGTGDRKYFSTEATNLSKKHSYKASGLANEKALGVRALDNKKGVQLIVKTDKANRPKDSVRTVSLSKGARPANRAVKGLAQTSFYRPDLTKVAQARVSQI